MPDRILFRGVRLVDPASEHDSVTDVMVEDEMIAALGEALDAPAGTTSQSPAFSARVRTSMTTATVSVTGSVFGIAQIAV